MENQNGQFSFEPFNANMGGGGGGGGSIHVCMLFCTPTTHIASTSLEAHGEYANLAP